MTYYKSKLSYNGLRYVGVALVKAKYITSLLLKKFKLKVTYSMAMEHSFAEGQRRGQMCVK